MKTFVNCSNHPSASWERSQITAAETYGPIVDVPFPNVPPMKDETEIAGMADAYMEEIMKHDPAAVMCQGEFTLCFEVVKRLNRIGIPVMAACSERKTTETEGKKISEFSFVRFRRYM